MPDFLVESVDVCERILRSNKEFNVGNSILFSENEVIDRILDSRENMMPVYVELYEVLDEEQIDLVLSLVVSCAAFWSPDQTIKYRKEKKRLIALNKEIDDLGRQLAGLLKERCTLNNGSVFSCDTHYSIVDVITNASDDNYLFDMYVKDDLRNLKGRFDNKYWPSIESIINEIARDAACAEVYSSDPLTEDSTASSRASKIDYLRALFAALEENSEERFGLIPRGFVMSDKSLAEVMNCALQLDSCELVDSSYVKRERQRQRETRS